MYNVVYINFLSPVLSALLKFHVVSANKYVSYRPFRVWEKKHDSRNSRNPRTGTHFKELPVRNYPIADGPPVQELYYRNCLRVRNYLCQELPLYRNYLHRNYTCTSSGACGRLERRLLVDAASGCTSEPVI